MWWQWEQRRVRRSLSEELQWSGRWSTNQLRDPCGWMAWCNPRARIQNASASKGDPPSDFVARHVAWDEPSFPSFERGAADAMLECGARGDGHTDDTVALQKCINTHSNVFLPKGIFRISTTLILNENSTLLGLSQTHSVIAPTVDFTPHVPLLRTARGPMTLAFVGLVTFWHNEGVYTLDWR